MPASVLNCIIAFLLVRLHLPFKSAHPWIFSSNSRHFAIHLKAPRPLTLFPCAYSSCPPVTQVAIPVPFPSTVSLAAVLSFSPPGLSPLMGPRVWCSAKLPAPSLLFHARLPHRFFLSSPVMVLYFTVLRDVSLPTELKIQMNYTDVYPDVQGQNGRTLPFPFARLLQP